MQNRSKERLLYKHPYLTKNALKSWVNIDADGNMLNNMKKILPYCEEGASIKEIFLKCQKQYDQNQFFSYEPRISCIDKKGVYGAKKHLEELAGVNNINSVSDILDDKKFDSEYQKFVEFLNGAFYHKNPDTKEFVNCKLDFIMRACAPAFIKSEGLVLADFDSSDNITIPRLMFLIKATSKYLNIKIDQIIFPLCESQNSIYNSQKAFVNFLTDIKTRYDNAIAVEEPERSQRLSKIRSLICIAN